MQYKHGQRISGQFNEVLGSHPIVWNDPVEETHRSPQQIVAEIETLARKAQAQPVTKERVWFPLPVEHEDEDEETPQIFTWTRTPKPAPKAKPAGYRYFPLPTENE